MIILRRFFDEFTMKCARLDVVAATATMEEWASPAAHGVRARQGGLRLSDIDSPSIRKMAAKLETRIGLPCDLTRCSSREQLPSGQYSLAWHQDYAAMELVPGQIGMVAWVPLDPIDGTRPGLEVQPLSTPGPLPHHRDQRRFLVADEQSEDTAEAVVIDGLRLGDIVLIDPYEPHRTHCTPAMTNPRLSLDMRFQ